MPGQLNYIGSSGHCIAFNLLVTSNVIASCLLSFMSSECNHFSFSVLAFCFPLSTKRSLGKVVQKRFLFPKHFFFTLFVTSMAVTCVERLKLSCVMNTNRSLGWRTQGQETPLKYYGGWNTEAITIKICCKIRLRSSLPSWTVDALLMSFDLMLNGFSCVFLCFGGKLFPFRNV